MLALELLESRQLLATTINWTNRGQPSDRFSSTFGADAAQARSVVDAAIDAWERVITDFNRPGGGDTIQVNISMESTGTGFGASTVVTSHLSGYPTAGSITVDRGNDTNSDGRGDGDGYFLDPTPYEHSEFAGAIVHAFTGDAQPGSPALGKSDLFTLVAHELLHVLGIVGFSALKLHNPLAGTITDTGLADDSEGGGNGRYFVFDGPSVTHLMTSNNGGPDGVDAGRIVHSAGPDNAAANQPVTFQSAFRGTVQLVGTQDIVNPVYEFGRRYVPTDYLALILHDAYGYDVTLPQTFGTFYAMLSDTGELLLRGRTSGNSADAFEISLVGGNIRVSVDAGDDAAGSGPSGDDSELPAYVAEFPASEVNTITIQGNGGSDSLVVDLSGGDPIPSGGLTYAGGLGNGDSLTIDLAGTFHATHNGTTDGTVVITETNKTILYTSVEFVEAIGGAFSIAPMLAVGPTVVNEGESVLLDLVFNPGVGAHTVTIDWGDGIAQVVPLAEGIAEIIGLSHAYLDDMPGGTPQDTYTVSVSVIDADDLIVFSDSKTVSVHNVAPTLTSLELNPSVVESGGQAMLSGTFSDPGTLDTFTLDIDGDGDGTHEIVGLLVAGGDFSVGLTLNGPPGMHDVSVRLHDDDGGTGTHSTSVTVTAPPVELGNLQLTLGGMEGPGAAPSVNEADVVTLMGSFEASIAEHSVTINWGDGTSDSLLLTGSQYSFTLAHAYLDDAPSVTSQDTYVVSVRVEEDAPGGDAIVNNQSGEPIDMVTVRNVAPFISSLSLSPATVPVGGQATLSGTFSDPGTLDTFHLDLDTDGDGAFEVMGMPVSGGSFSLDVAFPGPPGTHPVSARVRDDDGGGTTQSTMVTVGHSASSALGAHLFYNNSAFDGNGSLVTASDFAAIATDKVPLGAGQTASFANISGYSRGINGLFVDFDALPGDGAGLDAGDFLFRVGNDEFPEAWPAAPAPASVGVLPNAGPGGADRAFVTFADHAIKGAWLWVTVLAGGDTGLSFDEDFFFGAAAGETGASFSTGRVAVDAADLQLIAQNITPLAAAGTEAVTEPGDVNRDRTINAFDLQVVALNLNFNVLALITPQIPVPAAAVFSASVAPPAPIAASVSQSAAAATDAAMYFPAATRDEPTWLDTFTDSVASPWSATLDGDEMRQEGRPRHTSPSIRDLAIESLTCRILEATQ